MGNCLGGTSRPQDQGTLVMPFQIGSYGFMETMGIGIMADDTVVRDFYGIHGPNGLCLHIQIREKWNYPFFIGDGDIETFNVWVLCDKVFKFTDILQVKIFVGIIIQSKLREFFGKIAPGKRIGYVSSYQSKPKFLVPFFFHTNPDLIKPIYR